MGNLTKKEDVSELIKSSAWRLKEKLKGLMRSLRKERFHCELGASRRTVWRGNAGYYSVYGNFPLNRPYVVIPYEEYDRVSGGWSDVAELIISKELKKLDSILADWELVAIAKKKYSDGENNGFCIRIKERANEVNT